MSLTIRPYQPGDEYDMCDAHVQAILQTLAPLYDNKVIEIWSQKTPERYAEIVAEGKESFFVADNGERVVGFIGWKDDELSVCYLHPSVTGQGMGRKMFEVAETDYRTKTGKNYIKTCSTLYAKPFYEKMGFTALELGTHTFRDGTTMPNWKMIKNY